MSDPVTRDKWNSEKKNYKTNIITKQAKIYEISKVGHDDQTMLNCFEKFNGLINDYYDEINGFFPSGEDEIQSKYPTIYNFYIKKLINSINESKDYETDILNSLRKYSIDIFNEDTNTFDRIKAEQENLINKIDQLFNNNDLMNVPNVDVENEKLINNQDQIKSNISKFENNCDDLIKLLNNSLRNYKSNDSLNKYQDRGFNKIETK